MVHNLRQSTEVTSELCRPEYSEMLILLMIKWGAFVLYMFKLWIGLKDGSWPRFKHIWATDRNGHHSYDYVSLKVHLEQCTSLL